MTFRRDIEGLRAVAVIGVLVAHAGFGFAAGGYAGVDVFYVISGFLITGILMREIESRGSISLVSFYARRARRILPLAALVIAVTLMASLVFFTPVRRELLWHDGVASSVYLVNWRFVAEAADYFASNSELSPLQHYWSLAIEEQFYLAWPGILLVATFWVRRRGRPPRQVAIAALCLIAVLSLGFSVVYTTSHPAQAYFSTFTRVWELALGGLLALAPARLRSRASSSLLLWAGVGAIAASFLLLDDASKFPGYIALLPTLGAAAVIASGIPEPESPPPSFLTWDPIRYAGRVSYSWYLWHWPFVVFAAAEFGSLSPAEGAAAVGASFLPAALTHHLIERPVMESPVLRSHTARSLGLGAGATLAGIAASAVVVYAQPDIAVLPAKDVRGAAALRQQVLPQTSASALRPDPIHAAEDKSRLFADGCLLTIDEVSFGDCTYDLGDASGPRVVLFGDSHAEHFFPALQRIGSGDNWRLEGLAKDGCPPATSLVYNPKLEGPYYGCQEWHEAALSRIESERPDLVIVAGAVYYRALAASGMRISRHDSRADLESGYADTLKRLRATGAVVAAIADIPYAPFDIPGCVSESLSSLDDCGFDPDERSYDRFDLRAISSVRGIHLVDVTPYICPDDHCRAVIGDAITYRETNHLTATFARTLAPEIAAELPPTH